MKYVKKKLSDLKPYENNPRINDEAVDDVAESIKQCSYIAASVGCWGELLASKRPESRDATNTQKSPHSKELSDPQMSPVLKVKNSVLNLGASRVARW